MHIDTKYWYRYKILRGLKPQQGLKHYRSILLFPPNVMQHNSLWNNDIITAIIKSAPHPRFNKHLFSHINQKSTLKNEIFVKKPVNRCIVLLLAVVFAAFPVFFILNPESNTVITVPYVVLDVNMKADCHPLHCSPDLLKLMDPGMRSGRLNPSLLCAGEPGVKCQRPAVPEMIRYELQTYAFS